MTYGDPIKKVDHYVTTYMGTTYYLSGIKTVGQFKKVLEFIIESLPEDNDLGIAEVWTHKGQLDYILEDGEHSDYSPDS